MASISRQLSIHASSDPTRLPCTVHYSEGTGWIVFQVSAEERVLVFLTPDQMRQLAALLLARADDAVPSHHLDEVSS